MFVQYLIVLLVSLFVTGRGENNVTISYSYDMSDGEIVDESILMKPLIFKSTTTPVPPMSGPLYNFIKNLFREILDHRFSKSRLPPYLQVLSKRLKGLGSGYLMKMMIKRLARYLYKISLHNHEYIKLKLTNLEKLFTEVKPKKMDLFKVLNSIYTVTQDSDMDTYLYRLKLFGRKEKRNIGKLTRDVFQLLIFYTIWSQKEYIKNDIQLKFAYAVLEYWEDPIVI